MQDALRSVPGVECAHVDMQERTATVACEGGCDHAALLSVLEKRGYGAEIRPK